MCNSCGISNCNCKQLPKGNPGADGLNAFTVTTADFVQPAVNGTVTISVSASGQNTAYWGGDNQPIYIENGGVYRVVAVVSASSMTVRNMGGDDNAVVGATIVSGSGVSPAGIGFGEPGGNTHKFNFDDSTAGAGISSGQIRFNSATGNAVSEIYVSYNNAAAIAVNAWLATFDTAGNVGNHGFVRVFETTAPHKFWIGTVTGITDNGTYYTIAVTFINEGNFADWPAPAIPVSALALTFVNNGADGNGYALVETMFSGVESPASAGTVTLHTHPLPANALNVDEEFAVLDFHVEAEEIGGGGNQNSWAIGVYFDGNLLPVLFVFFPVVFIEGGWTLRGKIKIIRVDSDKLGAQIEYQIYDNGFVTYGIGWGMTQLIETTHHYASPITGIDWTQNNDIEIQAAPNSIVDSSKKIKLVESDLTYTNKIV